METVERVSFTVFVLLMVCAIIGYCAYMIRHGF